VKNPGGGRTPLPKTCGKLVERYAYPYIEFRELGEEVSTTELRRIPPVKAGDNGDEV